ncbi:MAG TPA: glycosyltransferase [Candidatus Saccharibacteria bacterium]|nr:glycosyltransferase [Candidatus Saccharibacteria bacterium]HMT39546.1 glycosyltransferase [Candidatus Saccharibacteria bacterium]
MRIAIVHDWLTNLGGGERVVDALSNAFPAAPIYTSVYSESGISLFKDKKVVSSFLQHWPLSKKKHQLYPMLRKYAFESFDFSDFDVVISSSSAESKGIITSTDTIHLSYIHTPTRYYWSGYQDYLDSPGLGPLSPTAKFILPKVINKMRYWDYAAAQRPDFLIANSQTVKDRIAKYYNRDSKIIFPPVEIDKFELSNKQKDYYLVVSRLIPYKRVDLAVRACSELGRKLIVVGNGSELDKLRKISSDNIDFIVDADDKTVRDLYARSQGFIFTAYEDFGITPVESMATGVPVITYGKGGGSESVVNNVTGLYFEDQSVECLKEAILKFEKMNFVKEDIRKHAEKFSRKRFIEEVKDLINERYEEKYAGQIK